MNSRDTFLHDPFHPPEESGILLDDGVGEVSPVIQDHVGMPPILGDALLDAPPKVLLLLALPRKHRKTWKIEIIKNREKNDFPVN